MVLSFAPGETALVQARAGIPLPVFTPAERVGLRDFWAVWDANYDEIQSAAAAKMREHPTVAGALREGPDAELESQGMVTRDRLRRGMVDGNLQEYVDDLRRSGRRLAHAGVDLATWIDVTSAVRMAATPLVFKTYATSPERIQACLLALNRWTDMALSVLSDEFIATKEELISKQSDAILELSTPVLEIREERLIVPIIGVVDSERARTITDSVLAAIRQHRAKVLILDITAVAAVDTEVAAHILKTIEAARLMGVETLVTGITSEVARVLVSLGIEMGDVRTLADLRSGSEAADAMQGMAFVKATELSARRKAAVKPNPAPAPASKTAQP
jgi:rsbT co-antagonist protein RsbR